MERCSDGGEDQGAQEAFMGQKKEESSRQFWKEPWATLVHSMILDLRPGTVRIFETTCTKVNSSQSNFALTDSQRRHEGFHVVLRGPS